MHTLDETVIVYMLLAKAGFELGDVIVVQDDEANDPTASTLLMYSAQKGVILDAIGTLNATHIVLERPVRCPGRGAPLWVAVLRADPSDPEF